MPSKDKRVHTPDEMSRVISEREEAMRNVGSLAAELATVVHERDTLRRAVYGTKERIRKIVEELDRANKGAPPTDVARDDRAAPERTQGTTVYSVSIEPGAEARKQDKHERLLEIIDNRIGVHMRRRAQRDLEPVDRKDIMG